MGVDVVSGCSVKGTPLTPTTVEPYFALAAGYYLLDGYLTGTSNYLPACALAIPTDEVNRRPRAPNGSARV